jgi:hypothetical protein
LLGLRPPSIRSLHAVTRWQRRTTHDDVPLLRTGKRSSSGHFGLRASVVLSLARLLVFTQPKNRWPERSRVFGCVRDGEAGETSSFINKMAGALPVDNRGWVGSDRARFAGVWQARLIGGRVERARMIDDLLSFFLVPARRRFARCPPWAMGPAALVARHVMFVWASHSSPSMEILRQ